MKFQHRLLLGLGVMGLVVSGFARPAASTAQSSQAKQDQKGKTSAQGQQGAQPSGPAAEEGQALQKIAQELNPDDGIQLAEEFAKKYPESKLLTSAYAFAAVFCQQRGEFPRAVEYGEKSLKANPQNMMALILMGSILPQPQAMTGNDLDKEKKLSEAENYSNQAIKLIEGGGVPKMPNEQDDQYQKRKSAYLGQVHSSLGMVHLQRSAMALQSPDREELAKAEQEYKQAVSLADPPDARDYYRMGDVYSRLGKTEEAVQSYTKASELEPALKALADQRLEELKKKQPQAK